MKKYSFILLPLVFLASGFTARADDVPYPKQRYDVTLEVKRPGLGTTEELREACDGKGHELWETPGPDGHLISVINDYQSKVEITLAPDKKQFTKTPCNPNSFKNHGFSKAMIEATKTPGTKDLGAKTVEGHPCHGFEVTKDGATAQIWIADEEKIVVHMEGTGPIGKSIVSLKSWSTDSPASAFEPPADYKLVGSSEQTPLLKIDASNH